MTSPGVNGCWCGCNRKLTESVWWASDDCRRAWIGKVDGFDGTVEKSAAGGLISVAGPRVLPVELDPDSPVLPLPAAVEGDTLERVGAAVAVEEVDDLPSMAQSGVSTPGCDCGHEGMAAGWHPNTCRWLTAKSAADPWANPDLIERHTDSPGWLTRLLHRLFGRTT